MTLAKISFQCILKIIKIKLDLSTNIDILLVIEKGARGGICHYNHQYFKVNNKYIKHFDKNKVIIF